LQQQESWLNINDAAKRSLPLPLAPTIMPQLVCQMQTQKPNENEN